MPQSSSNAPANTTRNLSKAELAAFAREIGFDECRIAPAVQAPHSDVFRKWCEEGRAGEMNWLARETERRTDPQRVLPGAQSVIMLGLNYYQGERPERKGRVARYAWGDDYHRVIEKKLKKLNRRLEQAGGRQRSYVDYGPVLERDFAALAGLGWQGKSTMLLNRNYGTWLFLSAVLTTLEFAPDERAKPHCGSCTRCIDACPTRAITAPYQLDARLCISYLTIENRGAIPENLRPLIGDRIFGCDECLDVCPWNRFARQSREQRFQMRPALKNFALRDFLKMNQEEFDEQFQGSPIRRAGWSGFRRNVCVALGNIGSPADLAALAAAADQEDPLISEHAQWAQERIRARHSARGAIAADAAA